MQEKWLIAVDLDGTLFHTDHQVSSRTRTITWTPIVTPPWQSTIFPQIFLNTECFP